MMSKIKNWQIAEEFLKVRKNLFPYGGLNKKDVFDIHYFYKDKMDLYVEQLRFTNRYRILKQKEFNGNLDGYEKEEKINLQKKMKGGCCGELAFIMRNLIKEKYKNISVEVVNLYDHQLIVIGREIGSNPKNINTWGKNAVMFDPWADKIYFASDFFIQQQKSKNIQMYAITGAGPQLKEYHYLQGNPSIHSATLHIQAEKNISISFKALIEMCNRRKKKASREEVYGLSLDNLPSCRSSKCNIF